MNQGELLEILVLLVGIYEDVLEEEEDFLEEFGIEGEQSFFENLLADRVVDDGGLVPAIGE